MVGIDKKERVICAITGESVLQSEAVEVGLFFEDGSSQGLYMAKSELRKILHKSIPVHPELLSDDFDMSTKEQPTP